MAGNQLVRIGESLLWLPAVRGIFGEEVRAMATINGTNSGNTLFGTNNADTINALGGNDTVYGLGGNDTITGGPGHDVMTGGAGADVFAFAYGDGGPRPNHDHITDFEVGADRLQFPSGAPLALYDKAEGTWVHWGADESNEDWVLLEGRHGATLAQLTGTATTTPPLSSGEFGPQVWGDEFNGTSLDRSKWPIIYGGDQLYWNGAFRWDSRMVSVGNGSLNIGLEKQPDGIWETSGISAAPQPSWGAPGFPFTYGKVEIRAKASQEVDGAGPCFLLWPASNDHWPPEVDILETPHGRGMFTNHWAGPNGEDTYETTQFDLDYSQWHVYGLEWTPNRLTMTVDGQVMKTYTDHIPSEPMVVGLQGHVGGPNDGWYGNANATGVNRVDISVDYVRVFPLNDTGTMGTQTLTGQQVEGQQTLAAEPTTQRGTGQQATVEGFGARPTDGLGDLFTINRFRGNDELYGYHPELDRILLSGFSPREVVMKEGEVNGREYIDIIAGGVAGTAPNATHVRVWDVANYSDIHFGLG